MGGTDTHLMNLLYGWPNREDQFLILSNHENNGLRRIEDNLLKLENVKIVTFRPLSAVAFKRRYEGRRFRMPFKVFWYLAQPMFFFWRMQRQSYNYLSKIGNADVLISDNGGYPAAWGCLGAIISAKRCKIPKRILVIHHAARPPKFGKKTFERFVDLKVFDACTSIVAVSQATMKSIYDNRFISKQKKSIDVIYNGIDLSALRSPKLFVDTGSLRKQINIRGKLLIGIMGKIERYKGHEDMIEALNLLGPDVLDKIKVLIIGEGKKGEIDRLTSLCNRDEVKSCLIFTGYIPGCSREIISQLDLIVVATKDFEGFGLTLAEAMSVGTPILATRVGGITEFVFHLKNGYLVSPKAPSEMAYAFRDFLKNRKEWLERAKSVNISYFSRERMGEEFYRAVIN